MLSVVCAKSIIFQETELVKNDVFLSTSNFFWWFFLFSSFSSVHTIKYSTFKDKNTIEVIHHCQKCNDMDFALFGNVRYISIIQTSCFTMAVYAAQTLPKVTILTEKVLNVRAEINSILRQHTAIIMKPSSHYILTESTIFSPWCSNGTRPFADFSSQLWNTIWKWVGNEAKKFLLDEVCWHHGAHLCHHILSIAAG